MKNFCDRKSTTQFTTNHHDPTTNSPSKNHVLHPIFAKTPSKNAPPPKKLLNQLFNRLLVGGPGVFSDELRGKPEVVLITGGDEITEDRVRLQRL